MNRKRNIGFWILIIIGVLLNLMMLVGQTGALFDYDFTVSIGLQDSWIIEVNAKNSKVVYEKIWLHKQNH